MQTGYVTDIGKVRKINEDSCAANSVGDFPYIIVADGMGGHEAGEVASQMAIDVIENHLRHNLNNDMTYAQASETIRQAFLSANSIIFNYSKNHYKIMGMGTTTTLAMVYRECLITAHVGDSRAYKITHDGISQITRDHSYVQELVARGEISPEAAKNHPKRNFITRAMGTEDVVKVDITTKDYEGETIILCSDGLTNYVDDTEIFEKITGGQSLDSSLRELVDLANSRGGRDNITIVGLESERG